MRCILSGLALAVFAGLAPTAAFPQSVPNLSGTWALQVDKSDFGMIPAPQSRTDIIEQKETRFTIKRSVTASSGEATSSDLVYAVDGKPHKNMVGPVELTSTLKWDGQTLVMESQASTEQGSITITDRYSLSEDGKTLTQQRVLLVQGQEISQKLVLVRQP